MQRGYDSSPQIEVGGSVAPHGPDAERSQQAEIGVITDKNNLRRLWTGLLAVVGNPSAPAGGVTGGLDLDLPQLSEELALESILKKSPAIKIAQAGLARSKASVTLAGVESDLE